MEVYTVPSGNLIMLELTTNANFEFRYNALLTDAHGKPIRRVRDLTRGDVEVLKHEEKWKLLPPKPSDTNPN